MKNISKTLGFTLAETLATLLVISIIALLTIPSLINLWQDIKYKTAYKKAYRDIFNAFYISQTKGKIQPSSGIIDTANDTNFIALSDEFKIIKICATTNVSECWECANGESGIGTAPDYKGCNNTLAFIDNNNRAWYQVWGSSATFLVDTNSFNPPNALGKDRFTFQMQDHLGNRYGNFEKIAPYITNDITTTYQWCPSGKCYFKSWLF